jgi:uncharacterized membrane protein YiaA
VLTFFFVENTHINACNNIGYLSFYENYSTGLFWAKNEHELHTKGYFISNLIKIYSSRASSLHRPTHMDAVPSDNTANKLNRFCISKTFVKFSEIFVISNNHSKKVGDY